MRKFIFALVLLFASVNFTLAGDVEIRVVGTISEGVGMTTEVLATGDTLAKMVVNQQSSFSATVTGLTLVEVYFTPTNGVRVKAEILTDPAKRPDFKTVVFPQAGIVEIIVKK